MPTRAATILIGIGIGLTGALVVLDVETSALLALHNLPVERDHRHLDAALPHELLVALPPPALIVTEVLFLLGDTAVSVPWLMRHATEILGQSASVGGSSRMWRSGVRPRGSTPISRTHH